MSYNFDSWGMYHKTYYSHNLRISVISKSVCPCKPFQPSLMVRLGANLGVDHLTGASLGKVLALSANIRLGWNRLPWTNTLTYYGNL